VDLERINSSDLEYGQAAKSTDRMGPSWRGQFVTPVDTVARQRKSCEADDNRRLEVGVSGSSGPDRAWWHDGALWWPVESADGRQRFNGERWVPKRRGFRVLQVLGWTLIAMSPVALFIGFGIVAGHPQYMDQPPVSDELLALAYACYLVPAPLGAVAVAAATWQLGRPGLGTKYTRVRWAWQSPPGWPEASPDWTPSPGWKPDPSWPAPPAQWRGWVRDHR